MLPPVSILISKSLPPRAKIILLVVLISNTDTGILHFGLLVAKFVTRIAFPYLFPLLVDAGQYKLKLVILIVITIPANVPVAGYLIQDNFGVAHSSTGIGDGAVQFGVCGPLSLDLKSCYGQEHHKNRKFFHCLLQYMVLLQEKSSLS